MDYGLPIQSLRNILSYFNKVFANVVLWDNVGY